ncbi:RNA polymerase sigma factor RpoD/SigA [Chryseolinea sp. H1M3-3]|uniref:sigma-70 family RNA polymerase sigma factor n=1 Tax=Chryseolinea sp. H1M3-3 TaxID=3034144 RepID=UPI0023EC39E7|nr:RNA polymerase sigma factor RpoD/SigA [Chryseolinea sp. H1M3-3]
MRQLTISKQVTNRESQSLDKYLQEIGKLDLISADTEVELARKIRAGDPIALEKLTKANLRFVVSVAKQYQNHGLSLNDLINEGNVGLIKAGQRFDETRGFKFISYAVWWIRQSIIQALAEKTRVVRLPLNRVSSFNKIYKTQAVLEQRLEREPSDSELADALDINEEEVTLNLSLVGRHYSIDAPVRQSEDLTLLDVLQNDSSMAPDGVLNYHSLQTEIERVLATLSGREADIITLFYGLKGKAAMGLEEIGIQFSITQERVRQIKEKAINQMRRRTKGNALRSYLK